MPSAPPIYAVPDPDCNSQNLVEWACAATPLGIVTIIAPALLSYLITGPMGANLLERRLTKKNPDYEDYIRRTSAFVPWPPKPPQAGGRSLASP